MGLFSDDCTIKNVGGFLKAVCQDTSIRTIKCANSDIIYDILEVHHNETILNDICKNDPKFYQACGIGYGHGIRTDGLLCGQFICEEDSKNRSSFCEHFDNEKNPCANLQTENICQDQSARKCNEICEDTFCEDEAICNGFRYGKFCNLENRYYSVLRISNDDWLDWNYDCNLWDPTMEQQLEKNSWNNTPGKCAPNLHLG